MTPLDEAIEQAKRYHDAGMAARMLLEEAVSALEDPDMGGYERTKLADRLRIEMAEPAADRTLHKTVTLGGES